VATEALEHVRHAYEAVNEGDLSELVDLFGPDTVWCGLERGRLWWRHAPG
jgi:ketosteroid isomerase-like protein